MIVFKILQCHAHISLWYFRRGQYKYVSLTGQRASSIIQLYTQATAARGEPGDRRHLPPDLIYSFIQHRQSHKYAHLHQPIKSLSGHESRNASGGNRSRSIEAIQRRWHSFTHARATRRTQYRLWTRQTWEQSKLTLVLQPHPPQRVAFSPPQCARIFLSPTDTRLVAGLHGSNTIYNQNAPDSKHWTPPQLKTPLQ